MTAHPPSRTPVDCLFGGGHIWHQIDAETLECLACGKRIERAPSPGSETE